MGHEARSGCTGVRYSARSHCPECGGSNVVEVVPEQRPSKDVKARARCACGRSYAVELERRAGVRKQLTLHGHCRRRGEHDAHPITIRNLSRSGLMFEPGDGLPLAPGEQVEVSFSFGHQAATFIQRSVRIARQLEAGVGAEFSLGHRRAPLSPAEDLALALFNPDIRTL